MGLLYCPHCSGELRAHDDVHGGRCPCCRLVVGARRARVEAQDDVRIGGFMANAARREGVEPVAPEVAYGALRAVALAVGGPVERLRMTDYDAAIRAGSPGPTLAEVLATFDTWKAARAAAGAGRARTVGAAGVGGSELQRAGAA